MWLAFRFLADGAPEQGLILRRRYWLYYALTFFSGLEQIFVVFAAFMMVEKFGMALRSHTIVQGELCV